MWLRVRLFWVKMISGNHFHPFPHVWLSWKILFSGKWLPIDQYFHLWPGNNFLPSFSLQSISGKRERERERERATVRAAPISSPTNGARSRSCDRWRDLAPSRDRAVDRDQRHDLATRRSRDLAPRRSQDHAVARSRSWIAIVDDIFLEFVFSFFFSKHQKIFSGKFFEMQPNTWKHFPFRKIAFPENRIFSGNGFTRTKHSLSLM